MSLAKHLDTLSSRRGALLSAACAVALVAWISTWAHAQLSTSDVRHAVTYRGYLENSSGPLDGTVDLELRLFDAESGGSDIGGGAISAPDTPIHAGSFSVEIDLPPEALRASSVWLEIAVSGVTLSGRQQLRSVPYATNGNPAGTIVAFGGNTPPPGWLLCDGSALRSAQYPALHAAIGTAWGNGSTGPGAGNGTNFNAPDLRGRFLRGVDDGAGRDPSAVARFSETSGATGDTAGSMQDYGTALPRTAFSVSGGAHTHPYSDNSGWSSCNTPANVDCTEGESGARFDVGRQTEAGAGHTHTIGGGDAESRPVNAAVRWIIKY